MLMVLALIKSFLVVPWQIWNNCISMSSYMNFMVSHIH